MANMTRQPSNVPSPTSSEENDSQHATPATKLSAFSPDENNDYPGSGGRAIVRAKIPPSFDLAVSTTSLPAGTSLGQSVPFGYPDPFISGSLGSTTTKSSADASKLSPAAITFTPTTSLSTGTDQYNKANAASPFPENHGESKDRALGTDSRAANRINSSPQYDALLSTIRPSRRLSPQKTHLGASAPQPLARPSPTSFGLFTSEDGTSRSLMIQLGSPAVYEQLSKHFNVSNDTYMSFARPSLFG